MTASSHPHPAPRLEWQPETRACPGCGAKEYHVLGRRGGAAHRANRGVTSTVVRCRACHLVYTSPFLLPTDNPYLAYTGDAYFSSHDRGRKVLAGRALARESERFAGGKGRLLELGCGRGDLLEGAALEGWNVHGVEWTPSFLDDERKVPIEIASLYEAASLRESYDVIWLAAILEHLYDPLRCLRRVHAALRPGGIVFIDVPNECGLWSRAGNLYMRLRGRDWAVNLSPTFPPFHVVGFCPRSLRHMLDSLGFDVVLLKTERWQNDLPPQSGFWGFLEGRCLSLALSIGVWLGMGAGITCWARRRPDGPTRNA